MTVDEITSVWDDHGFDDQTSARKIAILNDVISDICTREPWPFLESTADLALASNGTLASQPADLGSVLSIYDLTAQGVKLQPWRYDDFMDSFSANLTDPGTPYLYYFIGNTIHTYPIGVTDTVQLRYIKRPGIVAAGGAETTIAVPKYWHSVLWYGGLVELYIISDDPDTSLVAEKQFEKKYNLMRDAIWRRQLDSPEFIHMVDEFDRRIK